MSRTIIIDMITKKPNPMSIAAIVVSKKFAYAIPAAIITITENVKNIPYNLIDVEDIAYLVPLNTKCNRASNISITNDVRMTYN